MKRACLLAGESRGKTLVTEGFKWKCEHLHRFNEHPSGGFTITGGPAAVEEKPHRMKGRKAELEALMAEARALKSHLREEDYGGIRHRIAGIRGDRGMGKTRLVLEAAEMIRDDFTVLTGTPGGCKWLHDSLWGSLLKKGPWEPEEMSKTCRNFIRRYGNENSPAPGVRELPEFRRKLSLVLAAAASRNPLAVILEDIDRADSASIQTLREVMGSRAFKTPVLFMVTYENTPADLGGRAADSVRSLEITLCPLSREASEAVVHESLGVSSCDVEPKTMEYLLDMGGGNPLFLKKTACHALKTGSLVRGHNGELRLTGVPRRIPELIRASVLGRLYRLPRRLIDGARAASALEGPFTPKDVRRLFGEGEPKDRIEDLLAKLEEEGSSPDRAPPSPESIPLQGNMKEGPFWKPSRSRTGKGFRKAGTTGTNPRVH